MKIAILGSKGIPAKSGGIERHVEELATRLAKRGFDVSVFCRKWYVGRVLKNFKGVRLVEVGTIKTKNLDAISHTFLSTVRAMREGFDIYHFHGVGPSLLAFLPRIFRPSAKVVATFHCIDRNHQKWGFIARMALRLGEWAACHFAHETIVVSNTLAHYCREVYGCNAEYIPNGITPPTARGGKTSVLSKLGLAHDRYVVMVSRLVRHKGVHTLIEAWRKMKMSTDDEQVKPLKLVIVGDGAFTDEYVAEIRKMAKGLNDIVFAGFRTGVELDALLRHSAFAVHPSMSEGLPIAVLEEMSYAKAVLASDIPEQLEIIEERGYTFKAGNVKDLMLQMYYVATHPRERAARALKAQKFVTQHYRWDDIVKTTADLYRAVVRPVTVKASKASTIQPARRAAS